MKTMIKTKNAVSGLMSGLLLLLSLCLTGPTFAQVVCAPTYQLLHSFGNPSDGVYPYGRLMQGTDGALYGTTTGGSYNYGTLYKLNTDGTGFTVLLNFDYSTTGGYPEDGALIQGADGTLYGTARVGGSSGYGTVFKLNTNGTDFTVLQNFDFYTTGGQLYSGVMQGTDGALYGTASLGGSSGYGTVFTLNTNGTGFTVLKGDFNGNFENSTTGGILYSGVMQGRDGALYGTASQGGSSSYGTVFKLNTDGTGFTVLQNFDYYTTGAYLFSGVMQGTDGALYGTANQGGSLGYGTVFKLNANGTGFIVLKNLDGSTTGGTPYTAELMQGRYGALYGTAVGGGSSGYGTVFKLNPDGTGFTVLQNFDNSTTGGYLYGGLLQGADGNLYGTTYGGGDAGAGTVFRLVFASNNPPVAKCKNVTVPAGANCTAAASIDDGSADPDAGDTITVTQTPAGPYALGVTTVTLKVTDCQGASSTCSATVTIQDTTAPTITCPGNIVTNATSSAGAVVSFTPSAPDNCSVASVSCIPVSGSTLAIGTTTVTCRAIDGSANTNTCTFTVSVKGAAGQISDLIALVQSLNLRAATANSLIAKLQAAASLLGKGNVTGACGNLANFISLVNAQNGRQLTAAQANLLIGEATRIRAVLGC